jgi:hypothetical protein
LQASDQKGQLDRVFHESSFYAQRTPSGRRTPVDSF